MTFSFEIPTAADAASIEHLLDLAFGPDRQAKLSYRYRDGIAGLDHLARIVREGGKVIASNQFWPVKIGTAGDALLLGPVAVCPNRRGEGIGIALLHYSLALAREAGHSRAVLVGDEAYYRQFGFTRERARHVEMPGEPARLLACDLVPGAFEQVAGEILRADGRSIAAAAVA